MQRHILERIGENLSGKSVLDAGCGTGNLAMDLAQEMLVWLLWIFPQSHKDSSGTIFKKQ